ncbi:MAG: hypothetical protein ACRKGH_04770 [Dehalogenimonas sp.]
MKKPILTIVAVTAALLSALVMGTGVLAVTLVPGNIADSSSVSTGQAEQIFDNDGGAEIRVQTGVGTTAPPPTTAPPDYSTGTASAKSHAVTTGDGSARAHTASYIMEDSFGTTSAEANASAIGDDTHAYAYANAQIRSGSSGTTTVVSNAVATGAGADAQSDNSAYLQHGASGNLTSIGNAFASNDAYAYTDAEIILSELNGNLYAWTWVTSSGDGAWADGRAEIKYPGLDMTNGIVYNYALSPGVYFDYDVQGGNYGIAIVAVLDPTNIYAIAVSNSVGIDTQVLAKVYGQSVFVGVDIGERN